jgi:AraC family transcriptional regulator
VPNDTPPEHLHLLSSFDLGWDSLNLIYELEPADEMPETDIGMHFICIALDNFCAGYMMDGRWQHRKYTKGDVIIIPSTLAFPKTQIDREVPLIELFLHSEILTRTAIDFGIYKNIELIPQLQIRDPLIEQMGLALMTEIQAGGSESRLYAESMAAALSAHLIRRYCSKTKEIEHDIGGLPRYKLRQVFDYINEHLENNLTLIELASAVNISPSYFASLFKRATGTTPHQYVMQCRIKKAKKLLRETELSLVEICYQVGFQNQSHFTRVFRQYTNTTPKNYRDIFS